MDKYYPLYTSAKPIIHPKRIRFLNKCEELNDLRSILVKIVKRARLIQIKKTDNFTNFFHIVDKIIPNDFFGTKKHRKIFYGIIDRILTTSKGECIYINWFAARYNYKKVPWLSQLHDNGARCIKLIITANKWVMNYVIKPLIKKIFCFINIKGKNNLVLKRRWMSYLAKVFRRALILGYLTCTEQLFDLAEKREIKARGFLKFHPKNSCNTLHSRPIVHMIKTRNKTEFNHISKIIHRAARENSVTKTRNLYLNWKMYCETVLDTDIFGAKVDVIDAFGNININKLCNIIENIDTNFMSVEVQQKIIDYIKNQYVYFKWDVREKKPLIWKWNHGLLQGDWLSPSLCELYMNYLDNIHFKKFLKKNCFLFREVDDYFFCSTSKVDVRRFLRTVLKIHGIDRKKTQSNLPEYGNNEIQFCGHIFHMKTKHVKRYYNFPRGTYLGNRFKLWNIDNQISYRDKERFIRRPMLYRFNRYNFQKLYLNTIFNSERVVLKAFYEAMVYTAFKFEAVVMTRFEFVRKIDQNIVLKQLQQLVYYYSKKSYALLNKEKGRYNKDRINIKLFRKIGNKAFVSVLKKRFEVYKDIIKIIENKYSLKYVPGLKEMNMSVRYFQSVPTPFLHITVRRSHVFQLVTD